MKLMKTDAVFYLVIMSVTSYIFYSFVFMTTSNCLNNLKNDGILYPRESETRQRLSLDGLWNFARSNMSEPLEGFNENWYKKSLKDLNIPIELMPVPSSYNDITTDWTLRDHVGVVWYERKFFIPKIWSLNSSRVWLRFGSVSYAAQVWINGIKVLSHQIGHLPFQAEVTNVLDYGKENMITVALDNTLTQDTIPQGKVTTLNNKRMQQSYTFDFFNYAGIDRSVYLYTTPETYIDDITITSILDDDKAVLTYNVVIMNNELTNNLSCRVNFLDKMGNVSSVGSCDEDLSHLTVNNPNLWWPYLMHDNPGYLYTFEVVLYSNENNELIDVYRLPYGIRTLAWTNTTFLLNGKNIYLHGFGKHEDSDIRGKGLDLPLIIRDYNLIKWIGANAFRTSHYPYAEEIMDLADSMGIMVINECPAVNIEGFSEDLLENHKKSLEELYKRDKNRPSVIMWSVANEPRTQYVQAEEYFKNVIDHIKSFDKSRPVTIVESQGCTTTKASKFVDIISFNRYNGWYSNAGSLDLITSDVISEAQDWHEIYQKPVIMQEYGADTLEGLHYLPEFIWSEEYQVELLSNHFKAFDELRNEGYFIGEFIWNFADFKTAQTYTRVGGNKKGIFTRSRQPKASAHFLRKRYWNLAKILYNTTTPEDLTRYYISPNEEFQHTEL